MNVHSVAWDYSSAVERERIAEQQLEKASQEREQAQTEFLALLRTLPKNTAIRHGDQIYWLEPNGAIISRKLVDSILYRPLVDTVDACGCEVNRLEQMDEEFAQPYKGEC